MHQLVLRACGRSLTLECGDDETAALLMAGFGGLTSPSSRPADAPVLLTIDRQEATRGYRVADRGGRIAWCTDPGHLLFHVDKQIVLALQLDRPDLLFVHAGVVALDGRAVVLAAPAGTGKSTLTLALVERGLDYSSDELAPIDLSAIAVHPYRRALCLKSPPPAPHRLPPGAISTGPRFHVPVEVLPGARHSEPIPIAAFVFVRRDLPNDGACDRLSPASAAAHLMANALNAAAHPSQGLTAAESLATTVPSFAIDSTRLEAACTGITRVLGRLERV